MENITIFVPDFAQLSTELQAQLTEQLQNYADFLFQKYAAQTHTENYATVSQEELEAIDKGLLSAETEPLIPHSEIQNLIQSWR
jgi:predicted transcriptional regulator